MSFNNNVDADFVVLGSLAPYNIQEGNADAEFRFSPVDIASEPLLTHYRRALLNDPDSVKLRMVAEGAIISGATKWALEVIAYKLEYLEAPAGIDPGEVLKDIEVVARAAYSPSDSKFVVVKVTNNTTSY